MQWNFNQGTHTATERRRLGPFGSSLFDSGVRSAGDTYLYTFQAAGIYPYRSVAAGDPTRMTGTVRVPLQVSPTSGETNTAFTITWSSQSLSGYVFDVETRFRPAGSTRWGSWSAFARSTPSTSGMFVPDKGAGTYGFRARLRNSSTGRVSDFSPVETTAVTNVSTAQISTLVLRK